MSRNKLTIPFIVILLSVFLYAACSGSSEVEVAQSPAGDCRTIIDSKCVSCHYKTRICDALGTKSKRKWKRSIKFMVKQGAKLSKVEQETVVECLSVMPKGSEIVCK